MPSLLQEFQLLVTFVAASVTCNANTKNELLWTVFFNYWKSKWKLDSK